MCGPTLALCVIVRDEAARLDRALRSVAGGYDQLVVVDTGSQDETVEVARRWDAQIVSFTQANGPDGVLRDFAAARNVGIEAATTDYWWWMDADEIAAESTLAQLRAYSATRPASAIAGLTISRAASWFRPRLAPRDVEHRWVGAVHEWLRTPNGTIRAPEIRFEHTPGPHHHRASLQRNLAILREEVRAGRATGREYFYLARTLLGLGRRQEALVAWCDVLKQPDLGADSRRFAHLYLGRLYYQIGDPIAAAAHAKLLIMQAPRFAEAACLLGDIATARHNVARAVYWYERAAQSGPCPSHHLLHERSCYDEYPRKRLEAIVPAAPQPDALPARVDTVIASRGAVKRPHSAIR